MLSENAVEESRDGDSPLECFGPERTGGYDGAREGDFTAFGRSTVLIAHGGVSGDDFTLGWFFVHCG